MENGLNPMAPVFVPKKYVQEQSQKITPQFILSDLMIHMKEIIPEGIYEIKQKIEALNEKENKTHFFLASSPASGGPLGRGAALVELNPKYPAKGQKKYILSAVAVNETQPADKGMRMFDTDDAKHIARWIKERHFKYESVR